jgi:hypothetical protein
MLQEQHVCNPLKPVYHNFKDFALDLQGQVSILNSKKNRSTKEIFDFLPIILPTPEITDTYVISKAVRKFLPSAGCWKLT